MSKKSSPEKPKITLGRKGDALISTFIPPARVGRRLMEHTVSNFPIKETMFDGNSGLLRAVVYKGDGIGQFNTQEQADSAFLQAHEKVAHTTARELKPNQVIQIAITQKELVK